MANLEGRCDIPIGIPIQAVPNQSLNITLANDLYVLTIKTTNGCVCMSITRNGTDIVDNARCVANQPIIAAEYQEAGNFMFLTASNQLPDATQFGLSQSLFYFTADELAAYRVPPVAPSPSLPTVTAFFFNPIAQLPLRFAPQGYMEI